MFRNLVESGSHANDFKRRGSFFVGAVAFYAVLLTAAGVGSIYAINVRLDDRDELELVTLMNLPPAAPEPEARRTETRPAASAATASGNRVQVARVTEVVKITPYAKEVARTNAPELPKGMAYVIDNVNSVPSGVGTIAPKVPGVPGGTRDPGPTVDSDGEVAPPARVTPKAEPPRAEPPRVVRLTSSVISGKAVSKPTPLYPPIAKQARVQGTVPVQVLIDEHGRVVQATATGGHALLQKSAVEAAYRARFSPTLLSETPVKVSGVIFYNFVLQ
jgi:protein TonB